MTIGFMVEVELSRKQREFARREQDILDAAISLFDRPDWQSVTVEQIAKKAEIGKGTVYKHFTCKEELYAQIALNHLKTHMKRWANMHFEQDLMGGLKLSIADALRVSLQKPVVAKITHFCKNTDFQKRLDTKLAEQFRAFDCMSDDVAMKVLTTAMERGVIPKQPIEDLRVGLHTHFHGAMTMVWDGEVSLKDKEAADKFIRVTTQFMIAGIMGYQE